MPPCTELGCLGRLCLETRRRYATSRSTTVSSPQSNRRNFQNRLASEIRVARTSPERFVSKADTANLGHEPTWSSTFLRKFCPSCVIYLQQPSQHVTCLPIDRYGYLTGLKPFTPEGSCSENSPKRQRKTTNKLPLRTHFDIALFARPVAPIGGRGLG